MKNIFESRKFCGLLLFAALLLTLLPFLGETFFNTKGEPREAIVAVTMLQTGDWILPLNYGGDMQFKPPFLYWCIALLGQLAGGVTEYVSRLPSALACMAMTLVFFGVFARRKSPAAALAAAMLTFTNFEMLRAATSCRLDMLVTAFIVSAICALYLWIERGKAAYAVLAAVLMACGSLTKGPVAALLPCLSVGIYGLMRGRGFLPLFLKMLLVGIVSLIPLAMWYAAAFNVAGNKFADLMIEENVGRFTGKMSYESHSNPIWYNFLTMITGMLPYTLLLFFGLFSLRYRRPRMSKGWGARIWEKIRNLEPLELLSLTVTVVIFIFYCIPESKRSVYLLPIYPFVCYLCVLWICRLCAEGKRSVKVFAWVIGSVAVLVAAAYTAVRCGLAAGVGGASVRHFAGALQTAPLEWWQPLLVIISALMGGAAIYAGARKEGATAFATAVAAVTVLWWAYQGVYTPPVLNAKSDIKMTRAIVGMYPDDAAYYSYGRELYTMNFYTANKMRRFAADAAPEGVVIMNPADRLEFEYAWPGVTLTEVWRTPDGGRCGDTRRPAVAYRYVRPELTTNNNHLSPQQ